MIHRTSPFVFFGSPSPFRRAAPHRASRRRMSLPTYLPALPSLHIDSRALTISLRAIHDRFACRLVFSRHVFRSLPSISRVLSFFRAQRALGDSSSSSSLKLSSAGQWAPKDFIAALLAPGNAPGMCVHVRVIARETTPFISS